MGRAWPPKTNAQSLAHLFQPKLIRLCGLPELQHCMLLADGGVGTQQVSHTLVTSKEDERAPATVYYKCHMRALTM